MIQERQNNRSPLLLCHSLVAVGQLTELPDRHGFLLNVVLREQARLARHHLLNGRRYHQVVYVVIRASRLPFLRWDDLGKRKQPQVLTDKLWLKGQ